MTEIKEELSKHIHKKGGKDWKNYHFQLKEAAADYKREITHYKECKITYEEDGKTIKKIERLQPYTKLQRGISVSEYYERVKYPERFNKDGGRSRRKFKKKKPEPIEPIIEEEEEEIKDAN